MCFGRKQMKNQRPGSIFSEEIVLIYREGKANFFFQTKPNDFWFQYIEYLRFYFSTEFGDSKSNTISLYTDREAYEISGAFEFQQVTNSIPNKFCNLTIKEIFFFFYSANGEWNRFHDIEFDLEFSDLEISFDYLSVLKFSRGDSKIDFSHIDIVAQYV